MQVTTLGKQPVEPGLAAIWGWAFSGEAGFPEGTVEAAIDDLDDWAVLSNRMPGGGGDPNVDTWSRRCGFQATLNTFLLADGPHRLRIRVKTSSGQAAASSEIAFRVNNSGSLAETTRRLMRDFPGSKRIWADLIDSTDFPYDCAAQAAWFERSNAEEILPEIVKRHGLGGDFEAHLRHFVREGFIVLEGFIPRDDCERINSDLDALVADGTFPYEFKGQRIQRLFEHSEATRQLWSSPTRSCKVLSAIFDDQALPCQTLNFIHGSQQAVHQDVIHLTPFPQGFMCGVWVALEDIHSDAGPLIVYPGSHRLPRLYTHTVGVEKVRDGPGWDAFSAGYAPKVQKLVDQSGLKPFYYTPKAGSVLIWHENLAHGGSPRKNDEHTRKSIVSHYFARGAASYYDSQGTPAWTTPPDDD